MGTLHKMRPRTKSTSASKKPEQDTYGFRLYTTGGTPHSRSAILNLREICDRALEGRYQLEVIDIYQEPGRATEANVIAAPTLVKYAPLPAQRVIGDLSNREKVLSSLAIAEKHK